MYEGYFQLFSYIVKFLKKHLSDKAEALQDKKLSLKSYLVQTKYDYVKLCFIKPFIWNYNLLYGFIIASVELETYF